MFRPGEPIVHRLGARSPGCALAILVSHQSCRCDNALPPLDHHRRWATLLMTDLGTACCNKSGWLVTFDPKVRYIKGYYADFKRRMAKEEAKAAMEEAASWAASARARSGS